MKNILDKKTLATFNEGFKIAKDQQVWIHHPITEDLVKVVVKKSGRSSIIVGMPEDSAYYGQPDWEIKKTNVIGIV